ncbi:hypothetical protein ALC57_10226, partial [Trachymyrmex cornetzi]
VAPTNLLFGETGLPNIFWQRDKSMAIDSARFNDFLSANSRPSASPIESQIMRNYAHVKFRPEAISCRVTNECAFRLPSRFLVDAYGVSISEGTGTAGRVGRPDLEIDRVLARLAYPRIRYKKYKFQQDKRNFRKSKIIVFLLERYPLHSPLILSAVNGSSMTSRGKHNQASSSKLHADYLSVLKHSPKLKLDYYKLTTRTMATTEIFQDWDSPYENLSALRTSTRKTTTKTTRIEIQIQNQNSDSWISLLIASQLNTKTIHFWN